MEYNSQDGSSEDGSFFKLLFNEDALLPKVKSDMQLSHARTLDSS